MHVEQCHAISLGALQLPRVVVDAAPAPVGVLGRLDPGDRDVAVGAGQVVARRERATGTAQDHAMHVRVVVRLPKRLVQLRLELQGQGVQLLRPVQRDARATVRDFVNDAVKITQGCLLSS